MLKRKSKENCYELQPRNTYAFYSFNKFAIVRVVGKTKELYGEGKLLAVKTSNKFTIVKKHLGDLDLIYLREFMTQEHIPFTDSISDMKRMYA